MRLLFVLACMAGLAALDLPPSPADVPGVRIWQPPAFTHWPGIAYADEHRNAALGIPVKTAGAKAELGWEDADPIPVTLPTDAERASALVDLSLVPGVRRLRVRVPDGEHRLPLRIAEAEGVWPCSALRDGFPVDADGVPVVLVDHRPMPAQERTWALLQGGLARPQGRPLIVGDALEALNESPWTGLDAETRPATDLRKPHHACLVAMAQLPEPLPRTVVWCPGNGSIQTGAIDPEEVRLMGVLRSRFAALKARPLLVLALPPAPVEERLRKPHVERREALLAAADLIGWKVLDLARAAGDAEDANRVGDQVFTAYPNRAALARERQALAELLAR